MREFVIIQTVIEMERKDVERLFVYITPHIDKKYEEEVNMAMDCFIEEEWNDGELVRFFEYLMEKVKENDYDEVYDYLNARLPQN